MRLCTAASILGACGLLMLIPGCGEDLPYHAPREGVIEYNLSFPEYDPNGLMAGMLPERTTLFFNREHQFTDLSAGMGVFRTCMVVNTLKRELNYHMSVMSKRIKSKLSEKDLPLFNEGSTALSIIYTDETDSIAGYPCRKALAIFNGLEQPEIELWYTDAIDIEAPNWFGPYAEIPGVLLQYELVQYGMRMRLRATSVTPGPVEQERFQLKDAYQEVEPGVLHRELEDVLSTFTS